MKWSAGRVAAVGIHQLGKILVRGEVDPGPSWYKDFCIGSSMGAIALLFPQRNRWYVSTISYTSSSNAIGGVGFTNNQYYSQLPVQVFL